MKRILQIIMLLPLALVAQNYKERNIEAFTKLQLSGAAKVYYTVSDTISLKIVGDQKEIDNVETKVENGTLFIHSKGRYQESISIFIHNKNLNEVNCSGANSFRTTNVLKADSLSFNVSGASNLNVQAEAKKVQVLQGGATSVLIGGNTEKLNAEVSGASTLKAYELNSKFANVTAAGASTAKVYVTDKIVANASGASSIKIKGEVSDVTAEATTASSITRIVDGKNPQARDSTTLKWKGKKIIIIGEEKETKEMRYEHEVDFDHWCGFSIGVNGLMTPSGGFVMAKPFHYLDLNYSRCINFQLNFFQHNFHIYKNYVNLVTGFGIEWRRYMFENKTILNPDSSYTFGVIDSTNAFKYNKNLLKSTMLQVPLLFDFNTSKRADKAFHVSIGVIGQFMVNSKTKQRLDKDGYDYTKTNRDSYNMAPLAVKAHASLGYAGFTVFGEYNLTPLFNAGAGPQLYPFVAGVRIVSF